MLSFLEKIIKAYSFFLYGSISKPLIKKLTQAFFLPNLCQILAVENHSHIYSTLSCVRVLPYPFISVIKIFFLLQDIHSVSSLLKMYFRELPNPVCTFHLYDQFVAAAKSSDDVRLTKLREVVFKLPPPNYR